MDGLQAVVIPNMLPEALAFLNCVQGVFCSDFDRDAEYCEVFSGFSSAPADCLNRALNLAFQVVSIAVLSIS
jgi:hypothetical protein